MPHQEDPNKIKYASLLKYIGVTKLSSPISFSNNERAEISRVRADCVKTWKKH
jgi:hypothetical protein